jgi:hypothetical protein
MQRHGVIVVSSTPTAAQELRRQADELIEINELRDEIGRDPVGRPSRSSSEGRAAREQRYPARSLRNKADLQVGAGRDEWDAED